MDETEILEQELHRRRRLEIAGNEARHVARQHRRAAEGGAKDLQHHLRIRAQACSEDRGLGDRGGMHPDEKLVDELHGLSRSGRSAKPDVLSESAEDGQRAFEDGLFATGHHRQGTRLRAARTARDRRVEERGSASAEHLRALAALPDADRRAVGIDLPLARDGRKLPVHLLHGLRRGQRAQDDLGPLRHLARRRGGFRPFRDQVVDRTPGTVVHVQRESGGEQPLAHGTSHLADSDETYLDGHALLPLPRLYYAPSTLRACRAITRSSSVLTTSTSTRPELMSSSPRAFRSGSISIPRCASPAQARSRTGAARSPIPPVKTSVSRPSSAAAYAPICLRMA